MGAEPWWAVPYARGPEVARVVEGGMINLSVVNWEREYGSRENWFGSYAG
jgi:hypothetical protein